MSVEPMRGDNAVRGEQGIGIMEEQASASAWHEPVLVAEVLAHLALRPNAIVVDATVGTAGHSLAILPHLLPAGRLIAVDRDAQVLAAARRRLVEFEPQVTFLHGNFRQLPSLLARLRVTRVDGLLVDLGMSSAQVDRPERGFSFLKEGPLDMRMDAAGESPSAADLLNTLPADRLEQLLLEYGEERFARRIARAIIDARTRQPLATTTQLARLIAAAIPRSVRHRRLHCATRTFQALRIAVNDELGALSELLTQATGLLAPGGRMTVISFHSLEDRLVKRAFAEGARRGDWELLTKHPVRSSEEETARNPRARSAKLRAIVRQ